MATNKSNKTTSDPYLINAKKRIEAEKKKNPAAYAKKYGGKQPRVQ